MNPMLKNYSQHFNLQNLLFKNKSITAKHIYSLAEQYHEIGPNHRCARTHPLESLDLCENVLLSRTAPGDSRFCKPREGHNAAGRGDITVSVRPLSPINLSRLSR